MKNIAAKIALTTAIAATSTSALAVNTWEKESMDAWIDGKAETTLLLKTNLNSFDINTAVKNKEVTLTGSVDNDTEKALAEELVSGLEGVDSVNNELTVLNKSDKKSNDTTDMLTDTKITTVVKTRLLMDTNVSGTDVQVETKNKEVTLTGSVKTDAEHDLALSIAKNTTDVDNVIDKLEVMK
ncbi:MAG: BON domain-containing protein [Vibrio casei]|uniref:BON domain-containing protein n=1 Tax=Vibrio casei TaxID=673372 RepID=UPI0018693190|nr:BON domain-containing protein [Vibrio casei]